MKTLLTVNIIFILISISILTLALITQHPLLIGMSIGWPLGGLIGQMIILIEEVKGNKNK